MQTRTSGPQASSFNVSFSSSHPNELVLALPVLLLLLCIRSCISVQLSRRLFLFPSLWMAPHKFVAFAFRVLQAPALLRKTT